MPDTSEKQAFTTTPPVFKEGKEVRSAWVVIIEYHNYIWDGSIQGKTVTERMVNSFHESLNEALEEAEVCANNGNKVLAIAQAIYQDGDYIVPPAPPKPKAKEKPKPYLAFNQKPDLAQLARQIGAFKKQVSHRGKRR